MVNGSQQNSETCCCFDLEFSIYLPLLSKYWDCRHMSPHCIWFKIVRFEGKGEAYHTEIEPRVSYTLSKCSIPELSAFETYMLDDGSSLRH